jgi:hypothetical protein
MYHGTEVAGLGSTIYRLCAGDTFHAQGASYLGVVLEEAGILEWNGRPRGIEWRLSNYPETVEALANALQMRVRRNEHPQPKSDV